jgi:DNA-binding LytR/AlgR family response regulator
MLRIAIVEDEKVQAELLETMVSEWAVTESLFVHVKKYTSAESFLFSIDDEVAFDILLLDIQMENMNGVELAKRLRKLKYEVIIIFITAIIDYVFEGYEVNALHYILKPINKQTLFNTLYKANKKHKTSEFLLVTTKDKNIKIDMLEILYIEASIHDVIIHTLDDDYTVRMKFTDIKNKLDDRFIATHRSFMVNLAYIKHITRTDAVLDNGDKIPLSRRLYQSVCKTFIEYHKGEY